MHLFNENTLKAISGGQGSAEQKIDQRGGCVEVHLD